MDLPHHWFVACRSEALRTRPVGLTVLGRRVALFRDRAGAAAALEDRCPHRNAPLSAGRVRGGELECPYHGWRFDGAGRCLSVPGLEAPPASAAVQATGVACAESDGYVWVYSTPGERPAAPPPRFPSLGAPGYASVRRELVVEASLQAALENTLDVPHTAYLHGGLFRTAGAAHAIDVTVRRFADRCEAVFEGEPRPSGLAGRLLAPGGGLVEHVDRFLLPSIAQVEYRLGPRSHLLVTTAMTPVDPDRTRLFAVVTWRLPLPAALVRLAVGPIAGRILAQDARMLALQSRNMKSFGGERFASTRLDVLGPQIAALLARAAEGGARAAADAAAGDTANTTPGAAANATPGDGAAPEHEHRARMVL